jgi:hypothetical protein
VAAIDYFYNTHDTIILAAAGGFLLGIGCVIFTDWLAAHKGWW